MKGMLVLFGIGFALLTSGCATITKGSQQTVTISTHPSGAVCNLTRAAIIARAS